MSKHSILTTAFRTAFLWGALTGSVNTMSAEVTLRVHHFLPAGSTVESRVLMPWAEALSEKSEGRIEVRLYPSMQLGGKPPQLIDQVREGIADIIWTLPAYTPGRFPVMSAFELPFMVTDAGSTSRAIHEFYELYGVEEFSGIKPLVFSCHERGLLHTREPVSNGRAGFEGLKLRVPSRGMGDLLGKLGASPVFMPVPEVPESLLRGVIDGAVLPFDVTHPLRIHEVARHHTDISLEGRGFYTAVFLLAMNREKYDSLPPDLQAAIDGVSGTEWAGRAGDAWETAGEIGRKVAIDNGNSFQTMPRSEVESIRTFSNEVHAEWVEARDADGLPGDMLLSEAKRLLREHSR